MAAGSLQATQAKRSSRAKSAPTQSVTHHFTEPSTPAITGILPEDPAAIPVEEASPVPAPRELAAISTPPSPHPAWDAAYETARTAGKPLEEAERTHFEQRYGYALDRVRIHTDSQAAEAARSVGARAFTLGCHIVFDSGEFAPASGRGRQLLAHELAHVAQQSRGGPAPAPHPGTKLEREARTAASAALSSSPGTVPVAGACAPGIAREPRSLNESLSPATLSDAELQQEIAQVNAWLAQHGASDETSNQMEAALNQLQAEARNRRPAAPARTPAAAQSRASLASMGAVPVAMGVATQLPTTFTPEIPPFSPPNGPVAFPRIPGETPLNPSFGSSATSATGASETAAVTGSTETLVTGGTETALATGGTETALVGGTETALVAGGETAVLTTEIGTSAGILASIPVWGWIALGVVVVGVGIYFGGKWLLSENQQPVRPLTPEETQRARPASEGPPAVLPGSSGQNQAPVTDPATHEPLFTPAQPGLESGIDPVSGERLYTPAQQENPEPIEAARRNRNRGLEDEGRVRDERISTANKARLRGSGPLNRLLPDIEAQRTYMKWLEEGHFGGHHEHILPGSPEMYDSVEEFLQEHPEYRPAQQPATNPAAGQQSSTSTGAGQESGIDPVTGERLYTPNEPEETEE